MHSFSFAPYGDSLDWKNLPPEQIHKRVLSQVKPGSIIRFQSSALNTPAAVKRIVRSLREDGYELVTVSRLLESNEK